MSLMDILTGKGNEKKKEVTPAERKQIERNVRMIRARRRADNIKMNLERGKMLREARMVAHIAEVHGRKVKRDEWRKKIGAEHGVRPRRVILTSKVVDGEVPTYTIMAA